MPNSMKYKYFAVIPARGGSKGIPDKNLVDIGGVPLIEYTINAAKNSKLINKFIVSTNSLQIKEISIDLGCDVPFIRPEKLSEDNSPTIDVLIHSLNWFREVYSIYPKNIILLQPTSPFRTMKDIDDSIEYYELKKSISLASVVSPHQHPLDMAYIENNKFKRLRVNNDDKLDKGRQFFPKVWFIDGGIYIRNVEELIRTKELFCEETCLFEIKQEHGIDIDDNYTLNLAKALVTFNNNLRAMTR